MEYQNFDLSIEGKLSDGYQVKVRSETMGEAEGLFVLAAECSDFAKQLEQIEDLQEGNSLPMELGGTLHQCLFQKSIGNMLQRSLGAVLLEDEKGLRIRLRLSPPEVAALPWEVLYDCESKSFVCTSGKTPLTRYIEAPTLIRALTIAPPVKVLVLIPGGSGLDVENEECIITKALSELGDVQLKVLKQNVTRRDLSRALVEEQYHILHFIGHGTFQNDQGYLLFNSDNGGHDPINADVFADFFRDYPSLKLVVLNSCRGAQVSSTRPLAGMAPQLVTRGIPAVIAMQYPISDDAALIFSSEFYLKLCSGWSRGQVDAAISHARNRIHMDIKEPMAFATPVLFMRSKTGVIFDFKQRGSVFRRFLKLFTPYPTQNVGRLQEVRKTRELNIEALKQASTEPDRAKQTEAAEAIAEEKREIKAINLRIVKWLVAAIVPLLLFYFGFFRYPFHVDDWLEGKFMPVVDQFMGKTFSPELKLILADDSDKAALGQPGPSWRQYHGPLVDALSTAGAKIIVFDLAFVDSTPYDAQFANAIREAEGRGTRVILAKSLEPNGVISQNLAPELDRVVGEQWGNIQVGAQPEWYQSQGGFVRAYQLAQPVQTDSGATSPERAVIPSLALKTVSTFLSSKTPARAFYNDDNSQIQIRSDGALLRSVPVDETNDSVYDIRFDLTRSDALNAQTVPYKYVYDHRHDAEALNQFRDKIVLIGFREGDLFQVLYGEQRSGMEIHANVISNILTGTYVRTPSASYDISLLALMIAVGAVVRKRFRRVLGKTITLPLIQKRVDLPGLVFLAVALYLIVVILVYQQERFYLLKSYHVAAPFLAYWLAGKFRRRPSHSKPAGETP